MWQSGVDGCSCPFLHFCPYGHGTRGDDSMRKAVPLKTRRSRYKDWEECNQDSVLWMAEGTDGDRKLLSLVKARGSREEGNSAGSIMSQRKSRP